MKNGNYSEFLDYLYLGEELVFEYNNTRFLLQGWTVNDVRFMELQDISSPADNSVPIWSISSPSMRECADSFLKAPLWDGKPFEDIHAAITWIDC